MPFTYTSHQAPVVALKLARPTWFDGTALVLASMAPDFAYALAGTPLAFDSHSVLGIVLFCVPSTMGLCWLVRARIAEVAFGQLPDTPLRLHDYRVLALGRPDPRITATSALIGAVSHVLWDAFTHDGRWGARHLGFLRQELVTVAGRTLTVARTLQYVSHIGGGS